MKFRTHSMIDKEEWLTFKYQSMFKIMILFVSVSPNTPWRNGFQHGLKRLKKISIFSNLGSQNLRLKKSLWDQCQSPTGIGPITLPEVNLDAYLVWQSLESYQLRTSMLDAGWLISGWCSSSLRDLEEVLDIKDQSSSITINSTLELCWIIQISSGGTWLEFSQRTHQFQIHTENGELDNNQYSINTIRPVTDTESESQDTFLGMDLKTNQLCHILWTLEQMLLTVPSRETAIQLPHLSEDRTLGLSSYYARSYFRPSWINTSLFMQGT